MLLTTTIPRNPKVLPEDRNDSETLLLDNKNPSANYSHNNNNKDSLSSKFTSDQDYSSFVELRLDDANPNLDAYKEFML